MRDLAHQLPEQIYSDEIHVTDFQNSLNAEMTELEAVYDDFVLQTHLSTCTWGIKFFEEEYGIIPNENKPLEERKANVRAKMRGKGRTTPQVIKDIVQSFFAGEVVIAEYPKESYFDIEVPIGETSKNTLYDLGNIIGEVKPAHIDFILRLVLKRMISQYVGVVLHDMKTETHATFPYAKHGVFAKNEPKFGSIYHRIEKETHTTQ